MYILYNYTFIHFVQFVYAKKYPKNANIINNEENRRRPLWRSSAVFLSYIEAEKSEFVASVRCRGDEAELLNFPIHRMSCKSGAIVSDVDREGISFLVCSFENVLFYESFRKLETGFNKGIAAGHIIVLAVHIVVENQADLLHLRVLAEGILNTVAFAAYPEVICPSLDTVSDNIRTALGIFCKLGQSPLMPGNIAVVVHQRLLETWNIDVFYGNAAVYGQGRGGAQSLTEDSAGGHNSR